MQARGWALFLLSTSCAHEAPTGYARYVGGAFGGAAIPAGGVTSLEVISGSRLGTFVSIDGVVRADVASTLDVADDPPCSGVAHHAQWVSFGSRFWIDFLRAKNIDFGIAPSIALGLAHDVSSDVFVLGGCLRSFVAPNYVTNVGFAFVPALAIGFEFHEHGFGLRAWFEAGAHLTLGSDALSTISLGGFVGPVFRY